MLALPDVTLRFGEARFVFNGKVVFRPVPEGEHGALLQGPEDGTFTDSTGRQWVTGTLQGRRVRRLAR